MCDVHASPLLLLNFIVLFLIFFNFIFRLGRWHISKETLYHMQTLKYLISLLQLVMNWPRLLSVSEVFENHVWCNQALIIYTSGCIWKVILSIWFAYSGIYVKTLDLLSWRSHPSKIGLFLQSFYVQCEPQIGHGIKASWGYILSSEFCVSNQHAFCFTKQKWWCFSN